MTMKMLCLGAVAFSMMGGVALAAGGDNTSALDDSAKMQAFYTDSSMKTMRPMEEFKSAWMAMSPEDQTAMKEACMTEAENATPTNTHPEFCSNVKALGGEQ